MKHLIIDGSNLVHRAFWVSGASATAPDYILIVLRCVKSYVEQFKPDKIWCAWDKRTDESVAIRADLSSEYKQTRDNEYNAQVHDRTHEVIEFFDKLRIKSIYPGRGEADDIMFYLASNLDGKKIIVTADTDMYQLISDDVSVFSPIKKKLYDSEMFFKEHNFAPSKYALYKSIIGDKSDNIVGIDGVGKKRSIKMLDDSYEFSPENAALVEHNMKLISLTENTGKEWEDEYALYRDQIDNVSGTVTTINPFIEMCKSKNYYSIVHGQSAWYNAFFMKTTMSDIISKIFG